MLERPNEALVKELAELTVLDLLVSTHPGQSQKEIEVACSLIEHAFEEDLDDPGELILSDETLLTGIVETEDLLCCDLAELDLQLFVHLGEQSLCIDQLSFLHHPVRPDFVLELLICLGLVIFFCFLLHLL